MGSETEPAKLLLPYLQRADELQKHEPLVAYYCRLYAMDRGLRIPQKDRTKTTNSLLISLMNQLEKDKKTIKLGPDDNLYVEGFASKIFAKADKQDRAGQASLDTAKTFYAASIFFEILSQFGEVQPDIEQKQKYSVWKAADIRKALKEGRRPQPGPPGGDKEESVTSPSPPSTYTPQDTRQDENFPSTQVDDDLSSRYVDKQPSLPQNLGRSESFTTGYETADTSSNLNDKVNQHSSIHTPTSHPSYSNPDYHANEYHQPPPAGRAEFSSYHQQYDHQQYSNEQQSYSNEQQPMHQQYSNEQQSYSNEQQPMHQNYHAPENPSASYNYPNFQSYPSFHDSVFPAAPTHQPTYYHPPESTFSHQPPPTSSHTTQVQYNPGNGSTNHVAPTVPPAEIYRYDSNYQPPVEKIAEAHKAARFAVGALAFDDVATAVDFLKKSLELLTNPSAEAN